MHFCFLNCHNIKVYKSLGLLESIGRSSFLAKKNHSAEGMAFFNSFCLQIPSATRRPAFFQVLGFASRPHGQFAFSRIHYLIYHIFCKCQIWKRYISRFFQRTLTIFISPALKTSLNLSGSLLIHSFSNLFFPAIKM